MKGLNPHSGWRVDPLAVFDSQRWDGVARRHSGSHPLLDSRFIGACLRHFPEAELRLASFHRDGDLDGLALLAPRNRAALRWTACMPAQAQIGLFALPNDAPLEALVRTLPGVSLSLDILGVDPLVCDLRPGRNLSQHALTMVIHLRNRRGEYWDSRSKNLQKNLARYQNRVRRELGNLQLRRLTSAIDMAEGVCRYGELESAGWKGREGTALAPGNRQGDFYTELMQSFAATGQALIYELWHGGDLIASRLLIYSPEMAVILKTTFDKHYERYAPGRLLLAEIIKDQLQAPVSDRLEFYTNAKQDQLAWADEQRWIWHVEVHRSPLLRRLFNGLRWAKGLLQPTTAAATLPVQLSIEAHNAVKVPDDVLTLLDRHKSHPVQRGAESFAVAVTDLQLSDQLRVWVLRQAGLPVAVLPVLWGARSIRNLDSRCGALFEPWLRKGIDAHELQPLLLAIRQDELSRGEYWFAPMDPQHPSFRLLREALSLASFHALPYPRVSKGQDSAGCGATGTLDRGERWGLAAFNLARPYGLWAWLRLRMVQFFAKHGRPGDRPWSGLS